MKFYHFTASHLASAILHEGIRLGMVTEPKGGMIVCYQGLQWLTKNKSWQQEWCNGGTLPYDRAAVRFTIKLPRRMQHKIISWELFSQYLNPNHVAILNQFGDPWNWYLYKGTIFPRWIHKMDEKNR